MKPIKINPEVLKRFAYDTFDQEFPLKLYIDDGQSIQPTSQDWINKYYPEFIKHHPKAKILNFTNQENVDRYINENIESYKELMLAFDQPVLKKSGYEVKEG